MRRGPAWFADNDHDFKMAILGGAAIVGLASVLFGDRFWRGFLGLFSRE